MQVAISLGKHAYRDFGILDRLDIVRTRCKRAPPCLLESPPFARLVPAVALDCQGHSTRDEFRHEWAPLWHPGPDKYHLARPLFLILRGERKPGMSNFVIAPHH